LAEQKEKHQTKREWLQARLNGLEAGGFTGDVVYHVSFEQGGIRRLDEIVGARTIAP
jgi:hypothetical protein